MLCLMDYWVLSKRVKIKKKKKRVKVTNTPQVGSSCQVSSCSKFPLVLKLFPSWIHKALLLSLKGTSIYWELLRCSRYLTEVIACNPQTFAQTHRFWTQKEMDQVKSETRCHWNRKSSLRKREEGVGQGWILKRKSLNFVEFSYEWILFEFHGFVAWEIVTISTDILYMSREGPFQLIEKEMFFSTIRWVSRWSLSLLLKTDST